MTGETENGRILIVDDEVKALKYLSKSLSKKYRVSTAASAIDALELIDRSDEGFSVVVADQRMPKVSGVELFREMRKTHPDTVRILTTAYSEMDTLVDAINAGAVFGFVSKPWNLSELERIVQEAVEHHTDALRNRSLINDKVSHLKDDLVSDRVYEVGMLAVKLSHYINNALCPLGLLIDRLLDKSKQFGDDPAQRVVDTEELAFLERVQEHIREVSSALTDLQNSSRQLSLHNLSEIDLQDALKEGLRRTKQIREHKRAKVSINASPDLPTILGDRSRIYDFFRFLLAEEVVSLPVDSIATISLSPVMRAGREGVSITMEDNFTGNEPCKASSLFYPFNLRGNDPRDFGLFLTSCYFIVRNHGGSVSHTARPGGGLAFEFFLPKVGSVGLTSSIPAEKLTDLLGNISYTKG